MNRWTAFFLILLRLAIGWHFFFEGVQKIQSVNTGTTVTNRPFSSAGYFREAPGPMGGWYRQLEGDPDEKLLARLEVQPAPGQANTANLAARLPTSLKEEYDNYFIQFATHYKLSDEQKALLESRKVRNEKENEAVRWLTYVVPTDPRKLADDKLYPKMVSEQTRKFPTGEAKRRMTMAERLDEYKAKLADLRDTTGNKLWLMGKDVEGARLRQAKAELGALRAGLNKDVDEKLTEYQKALYDTANLTAEQKALSPVPPLKGSELLGWIDWSTRWGLTVMGACLLVGLLTRLNCFLAGMFLVMTYLAVPAFPWLPTAGPSEGNYLFVNKNVVEMLALFVLMTTASGRWFGLDAIVHRLLWGADKSTTSPDDNRSPLSGLRELFQHLGRKA